MSVRCRRGWATRSVMATVAVACLAACSDGGGGAAKGATSTAPPTSRPSGAGGGPAPAFCQMSPEVRQSFAGDPNDPQAIQAGLEAFIQWINAAMDGAPEQVKKDLAYLVSRYQQVKAAAAAGESPADALGHLKENREELTAAAATFGSYRKERCGGAGSTVDPGTLPV